ncbi:MAG TPA: hypothetical protein VM389_08445 [Phycisphaerae bacterium]|nr:hypothetical protein [Phycisphaerae bacterium]
MGKVHVKCPHCSVRLAVPEEHLKQNVRCPKCKHKFALTGQPAPVMEDVVAGWLTDEEADDRDRDLLGDERAGAPGDLPEEQGPGDSDVPPEPTPMQTGEIRVVKVEGRGVLIEFPTEQLLKPEFRSAFPRQCLSCDARTHLRAHVVIFAPELMMDSISMEEERSAGGLVLSDSEVAGLSDQDVLDRLHKVPNVPAPGDLPMPYWVCDMCSGSGQLRGQIHVNPQTGSGWCRLVIRNLHRAFQFLTNAGGESVEGFGLLKERLEATTEDPWNNMPEAIQHRLQQWFHPEHGETFLAYVPDRDHVRTEDGLAGVVISDRRLIYHTPRRHREVRKGEPLQLQHATGGGRGSVSITTPGWNIKHMTVDRDGITRIRRALTLSKFHAVWH